MGGGQHWRMSIRARGRCALLFRCTFSPAKGEGRSAAVQGLQAAANSAASPLRVRLDLPTFLMPCMNARRPCEGLALGSEIGAGMRRATAPIVFLFSPDQGAALACWHCI